MMRCRQCQKIVFMVTNSGLCKKCEQEKNEKEKLFQQQVEQYKLQQKLRQEEEKRYYENKLREEVRQLLSENKDLLDRLGKSNYIMNKPLEEQKSLIERYIQIDQESKKRKKEEEDFNRLSQERIEQSLREEKRQLEELLLKRKKEDEKNGLKTVCLDIACPKCSGHEYTTARLEKDGNRAFSDTVFWCKTGRGEIGQCEGIVSFCNGCNTYYPLSGFGFRSDVYECKKCGKVQWDLTDVMKEKKKVADFLKMIR